MTDGTVFSDSALARSLGTDDPHVIATAREMLDDPDSVYLLRFTGEEDEDGEPVLAWTEPDEEVERILTKYGIGSADVERPPPRP